MNGGYGIPFGYITPDVFGEKFGSGRIPGGTRGYTWSNWQGWLAPDREDCEKSGRVWKMGNCWTQEEVDQRNAEFGKIMLSLVISIPIMVGVNILLRRIAGDYW